MLTRQLVRVAALIAGVSLLVGACSATERPDAGVVAQSISGTTFLATASTAEGERDLSQVPLKGEMRRLFGPAPSDLAVVFSASQVAIQRCMETAGFDYAPIPAPNYDLPRLISFQYPLSWVSSNGFLPVSAEEDLVSGEEQAVLNRADTDAAFSSALVGDGTSGSGGCVESSRLEVFGPADVWAPLYALDELDGQALVRALGSEAVVSSEQTWSICMGARGYPIERLEELYDQVWSEPRPSTDERAAAVANWHCLTESFYRETLSDEYLRSVRDYVDSHFNEIDGLRLEMAQRVAEAQRYLEA